MELQLEMQPALSPDSLKHALQKLSIAWIFVACEPSDVHVQVRHRLSYLQCDITMLIANRLDDLKWLYNCSGIAQSVRDRLPEGLGQKPGILIVRGSASVWIPAEKDFTGECSYFFATKGVLLFVGYAPDLKLDVEQDIRTIGQYFKVGDSIVDALITDLISNDSKVEFRTMDCSLTPQSVRIDVIFSPTTNEFLELSEQALLRSAAAELWLIYTGHGTEDGAICMRDGDVYGEEFEAKLGAINLQAYPSDFHFILDCCFALSFTVSATKQIAHVNPHYIDAILNESKCSEEAREKLLQVGHTDTCIFARGSHHHFKKHRRNTLRCMIGPCAVDFWPLAIGSLVPEGALPTFFTGVAFKPAAEPRIATDRGPKWWQKDDVLTILPASQERLVNPENLEVTVFRAGHGDSTLVRWKDFSVLIDGGFIKGKKQPAFWRTVSRLQHLNLVILTHGDQDHISGLLPLIGRKACELAAQKSNPERKPEMPHIGQIAVFSKSQRAFSHVVFLHDEAVKAGIAVDKCPGANSEDDTTAHTFVLEGGNQVTVEYILPNVQMQPLLTDLLKYYFENKDGSTKNGPVGRAQENGLTFINYSGVVTIITCIPPDGPSARLLFTGDADGAAIASTRAVKTNRNFIYADIPHHGSSKNHQKEFLDIVNASAWVVSTDGDGSVPNKPYGHPDASTCKYLNEKLRDMPEQLLFFNHHNFIRPRLTECGTSTPAAAGNATASIATVPKSGIVKKGAGKKGARNAIKSKKAPIPSTKPGDPVGATVDEKEMGEGKEECSNQSAQKPISQDKTERRVYDVPEYFDRDLLQSRIFFSQDHLRFEFHVKEDRSGWELHGKNDETLVHLQNLGHLSEHHYGSIGPM